MKEIFRIPSKQEIVLMAKSFCAAEPFPHLVLDGLFSESVLNEVLKSFPTPKETQMYRYDNPLENKWAMDRLSQLPAEVGAVLRCMNSRAFVGFLEKVTQISGLLIDDTYRGGGVHISEAGGKLDVHLDFSIHPQTKLRRRLNAILYLNKDWQDRYRGHLEFWYGSCEGGEDVLLERVTKIAPLFNRLVIFETSDQSYHGFPDPIRCPPNQVRRSLSVFYYTKERDHQPPRSTQFVKRPNDPSNSELDLLRKQRSMGRVATNIAPIQ